MVQFTSLIVAVAALTTAVSAAPLPRPAPCMDPKGCMPAPQPMYEPPMKSEQPKYEQPKYEQPKYEPPMMSEPMKEVKVTSMMEEPPMTTSTMMHEQPTTTMMKEVKETSAPPPPPPEMPKYGSGSTPPPQTGYNDCVSKCMAQYGAPPTTWTPPPQAPAQPGQPSSGDAMTVLVAPVDGVLRYVPPMIDVPVGKTVKFVWNGTKNHTVSKGSALDLCNKTADAFFSSGIQHGPNFEFPQVVNNTDPVYFYCAVSPHCSKGMFGIVNMPKNPGSNMTVKAMMPIMTTQSADLAAAWSTVHAKTQGTPADTWGDDYDLSSIPAANREAAMSNVVYYRGFLGENPGVQQLNAGAVLPAGATEFKFPTDVQALLSNSAGNPAGGPGAAAGSAPTGATPTGPAPTTSALANNSNGAGTLKSSGFMVALVAVLATMVAL
jgi:plastocyanin